MSALSTPSPAPILPYVLPEYLKEHPDTYVKVSEESPEVLHKSIIYDGVDLVIGSINGAPDNYDTVTLCKKEQVLVVPKQIMRELAGDRVRRDKRALFRVRGPHVV